MKFHRIAAAAVAALALITTGAYAESEAPPEQPLNPVTGGAKLRMFLVSEGGDSTIPFYVVEILPPALTVGRPGGFYVAAEHNGSRIAYLDSNKQEWRLYTGGMGAAVDLNNALPNQPRYFHPLTGKLVSKPPEMAPNRQVGKQYGADMNDICAVALSGAGGGYATFKLYAGVGALTPEDENRVNTFHKDNSEGIDRNQIRHTYIQMNMQKQKTYWPILDQACSSGGGA